MSDPLTGLNRLIERSERELQKLRQARSDLKVNKQRPRREREKVAVRGHYRTNRAGERIYVPPTNRAVAQRKVKA